MIRAEIIDDAPKINCKIIRTAPSIVGKILKTPAQIVGKIERRVDEIPEPYYEVANEFGGITIIIGD